MGARQILSATVIVACMGCLGLGLIEGLYVALVRPLDGSAPLQIATLAGLLLAASLAVGLVLGLLQGLVGLALWRLSGGLAIRAGKIHHTTWFCVVLALLCCPPLLWFITHMLSGPRARLLAGRSWIIIGLTVAGAAGLFFFARTLFAVRDRVTRRIWGRGQTLLLASVLASAAMALYLLDQRLLVGLYPALHGAAAVCAVAAIQSAVLVAAWARPGSWIRPGTSLAASFLLVLSAGVVAGGSWALDRVRGSDHLRYLVLEHTTLQQKLWRLAMSAGLRIADDDKRSGTEDAQQETRVALLPGPRRPGANLMLITVDALRADHMGIHGYHRATTPNIDAWARSSVVFERAYCPIPHTSFSLTSLMTSLQPRSIHSKKHDTIAGVLRRHGYRTAAFFPPSIFFTDPERFTSYIRSRYDFEQTRYEHANARQRVDQVLTFLKAPRPDEKPFFIWVHLFDPHEPYRPKKAFDFGPRAVDRYDGEIAYVDHHLGRLIRHVRKHHPQTVIALTADHGEAFGEHGAFYHGSALNEEQVRVPAIISAPGVGPSRIDGSVQILALTTTLLSLVDVAAPAEMVGIDLSPWLNGEHPHKLPPVFVEHKQKRAIIHGAHKLIYDTQGSFGELYDLANDPLERSNIASLRGKVAADLKGKLLSWLGKGTHVLNSSQQVARVLKRARRGDQGTIGALIQLVQGGTPEVQREAIRLLTFMKARPALQALVQASTHPDPGIRLAATIGAALLGHGPSVRKAKKLARKKLARKKLAQEELAPDLRRDLLLALAAQGDRSVTRDLAALLEQKKQSSDLYERVRLIKALGALGDPRAHDGLVSQLDTHRTRRRALEALGMIRSRRAVPLLIAALSDDPYISWRQTAALALGQIGDRRAVAPLKQTLLSEMESTVVEQALMALARLGVNPVAGLERARPTTRWRCNHDSCRITLSASCGEPKDLLVLLAPSRPNMSIFCGKRQITEMVRSAYATRSSAPRFGARRSIVAMVGTLTGPTRPAALVIAGPRPPRLLYAALRNTPPRAAQGMPDKPATHLLTLKAPSPGR